MRIAAVLFAFNGLGFGIPCILGMRSLAAGQGVAIVMGFPAYGGGVFERVGIASTVPLLAGFLVVCALEVLAGAWLWGGSQGAAVFALALLAPAMVYWIGFSLPFGPVFGLASALLILSSWKGLS